MHLHIVPQHCQALVHSQSISQRRGSRISNFISFKTTERCTYEIRESRNNKHYENQFLNNKVSKHYNTMHCKQYTSNSWYCPKTQFVMNGKSLGFQLLHRLLYRIHFSIYIWEKKSSASNGNKHKLDITQSISSAELSSTASDQVLFTTRH